MTRCAEADRLYHDHQIAIGEALKQWLWDAYCEHVQNCPKCKQRMRLFTQAAKTAEMPPLTDDIG